MSRRLYETGTFVLDTPMAAVISKKLISNLFTEMIFHKTKQKGMTERNWLAVMNECRLLANCER